jgi:hypothetical protein
MSVTIKNVIPVSSHTLTFRQINIIQSYNQKHILKLVYSYMYTVQRNHCVQEKPLFPKENQS